MPEVSGPAALLVNPRDVGAIAAGIEQIVADSALRDSLIARGFVQAGASRGSSAAEQAIDPGDGGASLVMKRQATEFRDGDQLSYNTGACMLKVKHQGIS